MWKMKLILILICVLHQETFGAIYHLNASEYERMPPLFGLDEYEACLNEPGGSYCLVKVELFAEPDNELMKVIREYSEMTTKHYNHTYIERGVCVRKTCQRYLNTSSSRSLSSTLGDCINDIISSEYGLQARVSEVYYCNEHEEPTVYSSLDWAFVVLCLLILMTNMFGTGYDYIINNALIDVDHDKGNKLITSFSIIRNWQWLVSAQPEDERIRRLKGLHGIRSFSNICIVCAHALWIIACGFNDDREFEKTYEAAYYQVLYNGMMIVQVFFLVSGFLLVYHTRIQAEKYRITWAMIPQVMLVRWWRLSPALGVTLMFTTTWMRHLGSGPLWKHYVTNTVVRDCRIYWWHHLLYINNYAPEDKFCLIQTWHIAADTQLFLIGLAVYIATQRRGLYAMLAVLLALGIVFPALHVYLWDLDGVTLMYPEWFRTMYNDTFRYLHILGHNNLACFAIGMLLGDIVYKLQGKNIDISKYKSVNLAGFIVIPSVILLMYYGHVFYADGARAAVWARAAYAAAHRPIMGLLVGFGLIAGIMKCDNPLRGIFEWRGWMVPSRLAYAMYLIHFNLIYMYMGSRREIEHVSFYYLIILCIAFYGLSFILSLPFFLVVEAPMNRLLKTLLDLGKSKQGEAMLKVQNDNTIVSEFMNK